jgi:hypothetical protein
LVWITPQSQTKSEETAFSHVDHKPLARNWCFLSAIRYNGISVTFRDIRKDRHSMPLPAAGLAFTPWTEANGNCDGVVASLCQYGADETIIDNFFLLDVPRHAQGLFGVIDGALEYCIFHDTI